MNFDRSEVIKWLLFAGVSLTALFFFFQFFKAMQRWFKSSEAEEKKEKEFVSKLPDLKPIPIESGGAISLGFEPQAKAIAADLHKVLSENYYTSLTARVRCEVCQKALKRNNNELILIYNQYKADYGRSLNRDLMDIVYTGCYPWEDNAPTMLKERISQLNGI